MRNLLLTLGVASIIGVAGFFASTGYFYLHVSQDLPELENYSSPDLAQTSVVYDRNGDTIGKLYDTQNRYSVPIEEMDPTLRQAVIAIEDQRFYSHDGIDFEAIARAAWVDLKTLSLHEGGSTITQQLIKNTYIAQQRRSVPSFERKIIEASLAREYEEEHSKDEILGSYLNTVYFGANAYGAEAAARTYFNKSAEELTLSESAMLAGIINLPGSYDPFTDRKSARERRDVVLDRMLSYGYITEGQHDEAVSEGLNLSRGRVGDQTENEDYFLDAVRKELIDEYGKQTIYEGGLEIHTTLDPTLQNYANEAVEGVVSPEAGDPSASLVSVDPRTGAVRAMVGGSDFDEVKFNLATQARRQPGSAFKPFVMAEALDQDVSLKTRYTSKDLRIPWPPGSVGEYYTVRNYEGIVRGSITIRKAIEESDNTVLVQLALDLGLNKVIDMAHKIGVESKLGAYPSLAIGGLGEGVTPLEMASAYSTFPNGGVHMEPHLVKRITEKKDGEEEIMEDHSASGERALSSDEAAKINQALRGVITDGTASYYRDVDEEIGRPSAAKTGTSENFVDAWFIGYIPQLTTSVWVGYPEERKPMVNIRGLEEINGENFPLDIWSAYMQQAVDEYPEREFEKPSNLDLDRGKPGEKGEKETTGGEDTAGDEGPPELRDFSQAGQPGGSQGDQAQPASRPQRSAEDEGFPFDD